MYFLICKILSIFKLGLLIIKESDFKNLTLVIYHGQIYLYCKQNLQPAQNLKTKSKCTVLYCLHCCLRSSSITKIFVSDECYCSSTGSDNKI